MQERTDRETIDNQPTLPFEELTTEATPDTAEGADQTASAPGPFTVPVRLGQLVTLDGLTFRVAKSKGPYVLLACLGATPGARRDAAALALGIEREALSARQQRREILRRRRNQRAARRARGRDAD